MGLAGKMIECGHYGLTKEVEAGPPSEENVLTLHDIRCRPRRNRDPVVKPHKFGN